MVKSKSIKTPSNRNFGIVFFIFFFIISLYPLLNGESLRIWTLLISFFFLTLGLLNSTILTPLNNLWFNFGFLIGKLASPVIMGIIFFFVVTPIGLIMRFSKKDLLNLKFSSDNTYWIKKESPKSKMKDQF